MYGDLNHPPLGLSSHHRSAGCRGVEILADINGHLVRDGHSTGDACQEVAVWAVRKRDVIRDGGVSECVEFDS
jgi:hypothetical protein